MKKLFVCVSLMLGTFSVTAQEYPSYKIIDGYKSGIVKDRLVRIQEELNIACKYSKIESTAVVNNCHSLLNDVNALLAKSKKKEQVKDNVLDYVQSSDSGNARYLSDLMTFNNIGWYEDTFGISPRLSCLQEYITKLRKYVKRTQNPGYITLAGGTGWAAYGALGVGLGPIGVAGATATLVTGIILNSKARDNGYWDIYYAYEYALGLLRNDDSYAKRSRNIFEKLSGGEGKDFAFKLVKGMHAGHLCREAGTALPGRNGIRSLSIYGNMYDSIPENTDLTNGNINESSRNEVNEVNGVRGQGRFDAPSVRKQ